MHHSDLVELFTANYRLCEIGPGQTVAVLSEGGQLRDYAEASLEAVLGLGAHPIDVKHDGDRGCVSANRHCFRESRGGPCRNDRWETRAPAARTGRHFRIAHAFKSGPPGSTAVTSRQNLVAGIRFDPTGSSTDAVSSVGPA